MTRIDLIADAVAKTQKSDEFKLTMKRLAIKAKVRALSKRTVVVKESEINYLSSDNFDDNNDDIDNFEGGFW